MRHTIAQRKTLKKAVRVKEYFDDKQVIAAIEQWLEFGEHMLASGCQSGYFSGGGWAARCLSFHLNKLKGKK